MLPGYLAISAEGEFQDSPGALFIRVKIKGGDVLPEGLVPQGPNENSPVRNAG